ncbi:MFS transporter [Bacillus sp. CLL-7-23]|uniref:MFS transporter n=1 Tax=Bacillus changyiensis TaxID=3004103 RepID=A0ABT4X329_9BACI|nr:MFS transporter [Bacillus changyiensis]MDA7026698.1 MFS transporter [Bacillus changyiensis]
MDRFNKRNIMITMDIIRFGLLLFIPLSTSLFFIYILIFLINMASSIFSPSSMTYITKLISEKKRKCFNSVLSLVNSGAFLIGPAVADLLFMVGSPILAIYCNAGSFLFSGLIMLWMPKLEKTEHQAATVKMSWSVIRQDWIEVYHFSKNALYMMTIYFLYHGSLLIAGALDVQETVFAKNVLHLTNSQYGVLVSVSGAGILTGSLFNSIAVKYFPINLLIGFGTILFASGYVMFSLSTTVTVTALGFFIFAFFLAFANTVFLTFYQKNVDGKMMGRITSIYSLFHAILNIFVTLLVGLTANLFTVKPVFIVGSFVMLFITVILCMMTFLPSKNHFYIEADQNPTY